jgi:putative membrane protein
MHHVGPFLIALAWPGATIRRGMPASLRRITGNRAILWIIDRLQEPVLAGILFVGLLLLWLIPTVHFRAMIDPRLYAAMNWSMVIDGILFWCLVLDPRPRPPARLSFAARILLAFGVQVPQIAAGALISFTDRDLYSYYTLCGRVFPAIGAHLDQQIGGFVVWFPGGMMSAIAVLILFHAIWMEEENTALSPGAVASSSSSPIQPRQD